MDINYIIFDYSEIDKIDFKQVLETSIDTIRLTHDGLKTFVKWIGDEPECISNLITKSIIYNNKEMLEILDQSEWFVDIAISGTTIN
jgi:hypothetical protein